MGEWDVGRVERKLLLTGSGMAATADRLADLEQRKRQIEKTMRPAPVKPFAAVLAQNQADAPPTPLSAKEEKRRALPKKALRPSVRHPARKKTYRDGEEADEPFVIKG